MIDSRQTHISKVLSDFLQLGFGESGLLDMCEDLRFETVDGLLDEKSQDQVEPVLVVKVGPSLLALKTSEFLLWIMESSFVHQL